MSLSLELGTKPKGIEVKTAEVGPQTVYLNGDGISIQISLQDFLAAAEYVLCNTDLRLNDPRLEFVKRISSMKEVDGYNSDRKRLAVAPPADDMTREPVLCFVKDGSAWFTTQPLEEQWGDDWNDAPYEYNAGPPHRSCRHNEPERRKNGKLCDCAVCKREWNEDGTPKWEIIEVGYEAELETPEGYFFGPLSVEVINGGIVPWLFSPRGAEHKMRIFAGTTLQEFKKLIESIGGHVFDPVQEEQEST